MNDSSNRVVALVFSLLVVAMLVLVVGAGACSPHGGGGGPATPSANSNTSDVKSGETTAPPATSVDSLADSATLEELEAELSTSYAPVGDNVRDAYTSATVPTANAVYASLAQRGFEDVHVLVDFDITGTYHDLSEVDEASTDVYPSYLFTYASPHDVAWNVYVNDGYYLAIPIAYGSDTIPKQIILAEQDFVTQYDGIKNEFSDFSLNSLGDVIGIRVDALDRSTLDAYTFEQLNAM